MIVIIELLLELEVKSVIVRGDSQLVIYQEIGDFKYESDPLINQYETTQELLEEFDQVELQCVSMMYNNLANESSQMASGYSKMLNAKSTCEYG